MHNDLSTMAHFSQTLESSSDHSRRQQVSESRLSERRMKELQEEVSDLQELNRDLQEKLTHSLQQMPERASEHVKVW